MEHENEDNMHFDERILLLLTIDELLIVRDMAIAKFKYRWRYCGNYGLPIILYIETRYLDKAIRLITDTLLDKLRKGNREGLNKLSLINIIDDSIDIVPLPHFYIIA